MRWTVPTPLDHFAALVGTDDGFPLTEAAVAIAMAEHPALDVQGVLAELDGLALRLQRRIPADASAEQRVRLLHRFFFDELGFSGNANDFYSVRNSHVHEVLRTRRGIPITLAVIYLELATQIGLRVQGVSFPGHFLVRLSLPEGDAVMDPLTGESLSREAIEEWAAPFLERQRPEAGLGSAGRAEMLRHLLAPATPREIIARMLRNLEALHQSSDDPAKVLPIQQRLVALLPSEWSRRRDRGYTLADLGQTQEAIDDLSAYLDRAGDAADLAQVRAHLMTLRGRRSSR
ncbi:regulator of sirC expression with transglutaminase-like and TPR domain [Sphaerotilus hippei]|uniref:Regulator of sirC expression with transglutaminase-like and TPR domain n=1 Tax=Sphaerotilus hippei TaxID=744406 RepID=A0A318H895_9BURK|nr:transglutaminase-like domain-containing protein [Sphaerotilus hippei]PXW94176.1 regulator of sirC expression with transglutaminase-like and TPR domain [Sphaerotilus hippei]